MKDSESPLERSFRRGTYVSFLSSPLAQYYDLYENWLGKEILDAGCGIGNHTMYLAKRGKDVVALDYSNAALNILKDRITDKPYRGRVQLIRGSIDCLPLLYITEFLKKEKSG